MARKEPITEEVVARDEALIQSHGPDPWADVGPLVADDESTPGSQTDIDPVFDDDGNWGYSFEYWLEQKRIKTRQLREKAQSIYGALYGWQHVQTQSQWANISQAAADEYYSGHFFLEQLGAERLLDPKLLATLWNLRNGIIEDMRLDTGTELMLLDLMLIGYYNTLRVQRWMGDLALTIEREFFDDYGPSIKRNKRDYQAESLNVEGSMARMREQLLPLLDRSNRMMIRNLRALQELRRGPMPTVAIGKAEQVNVGQQQVNAKG